MSDPAIEAAWKVCKERAILNDLPFGVNAAEAEIAVEAAREVLMPLREAFEKQRRIASYNASLPAYEVVLGVLDELEPFIYPDID